METSRNRLLAMICNQGGLAGPITAPWEQYGLEFVIEGLLHRGVMAKRRPGHWLVVSHSRRLRSSVSLSLYEDSGPSRKEKELASRDWRQVVVILFFNILG